MLLLDNHSDEDAAQPLSPPAPPAQLSERTGGEPNSTPEQLLGRCSHTGAAQILLRHTIKCGEFDTDALSKQLTEKK